MEKIKPDISTAHSICAKINAALSILGLRFVSHAINGSWGISILIMEKSGKAFCRVFWYHDDIERIYLDFLSVNETIRKKGIATKLQEFREEIGLELGFTTSCLWVKKYSWMHDWYLRRGYQDWQDYDGEENCVWMKKVLIKN